MDWWENGKWYCPSPHPPWFLDRLGILKDCRWIEQSQGFMKEADPAVLACEVLRRMCKTDHSPTTGDSVECSWIPPTAVLLAADISVSPEEICKSLVDDLGVSWFLLKPIQVPVRDENDHIFCLDMSATFLPPSTQAQIHLGRIQGKVCSIVNASWSNPWRFEIRESMVEV